MALFLGGCAQRGVVKPIAFERSPAWAQALSRASVAKIKGDPARLSDDVKRAVKRSHWGLLRLMDAPKGTDAPMSAAALLPDGRHATILVTPGSAGGENTVAVRVGQFGDANEERAFLQTLADTLRGKPKPVRDSKFTLPENWPEPATTRPSGADHR
ncbi:MAG: hypothetical protein K8S99_01295 [Planctomycetes bacterium]|nr:hypothetical protein [Planctomycetota bacterium]